MKIEGKSTKKIASILVDHGTSAKQKGEILSQSQKQLLSQLNEAVDTLNYLYTAPEEDLRDDLYAA